jgi:hypothetical protein
VSLVSASKQKTESRNGARKNISYQSLQASSRSQPSGPAYYGVPVYYDGGHRGYRHFW